MLTAPTLSAAPGPVDTALVDGGLTSGVFADVTPADLTATTAKLTDPDPDLTGTVSPDADDTGTEPGPVAQLLARCHAGDQRAWDEVVATYGRLVYSVARRHRLSSAECDDVAQATWMRLVQRSGAIRKPESLGDWLATVARNESLRIITRERRALPMEDPFASQLEQGDPNLDPAEIAVRNEGMREVATALERLTPQARDLLGLVLMDPPPSYAQIAATLGMPTSSIGPTRTRCLRKLREALTEVRAENAEHGTRGCPDPAGAGSSQRRRLAKTQPPQPTERTPIMPEVDAFAIVQDAVAATLGLPPELVTADATLIDDLGATSLDIVEILFRIEVVTDVLLPFEDMVAFVRGDVSAADFAGPTGIVTDEGRRQLIRALPQWTESSLPNPVHVADVMGLVVIGNITERLQARLTARAPRVPASVVA